MADAPPAAAFLGACDPSLLAASDPSLLASPLLPDVLLLLPDGTTLAAHRRLLSLRSRHFRCLLARHPSARVPVAGVSRAALLAVLEYVYTRHARLAAGEFEFATEVLRAAHALRIGGLKALCVVAVRGGVGVENVAEVCRLAEEVESETLKVFCFGFVMRNVGRVCKTRGFQRMVREEFGIVLEILRFAEAGRGAPVARKRALA